MQKKFDLAVEWVHFPLHPDTPLEGRSLNDLFSNAPPEYIQGMRERLKTAMAEEGLPYGDRTHTYNSRLAQELGRWASDQPGGEAIHDVLFKAYFVEAVDIGSAENLVPLAERAGLDGAAAREVLEQRSFQEAVDADWQRAANLGITAVPTFVAGGYGVVGAQPYEALEQLITEARKNPRVEPEPAP